MKRILLTLSVTLGVLVAQAQNLLNENFSYNVGQLTANGGGSNVSGGNWTLIGGTVQLTVDTGSLTYASYLSSGIGNKLRMRDTSASAEDSYRNFSANISTGSVYASFLLQVNDTARMLDNSTAGDYAISFLPSGSTTNYAARLTFRKASSGNAFNLGIRTTSTGSTVVVYSPVNYTPGVTYLVVIGYTVVTGAANDTSYLWVNPTLNGTIPAPDAKCPQLGASTDAVDLGRFAVRQSGGTPDLFLDGIRVGTSWTNSVVPVKLLNFDAVSANKQTILNWSTASELNNQGFDIQKSTDGKSFESIGFVKGNGTTDKVSQYTFTDFSTTSGTVFYRLKQIDFDGAFTYSPVVSVKNKELSVELTPNPFSGTLVINSETTITQVEIADITGKTRMSHSFDTNKAMINTDELSSGIYFVKIYSGETITTRRIVKN